MTRRLAPRISTIAALAAGLVITPHATADVRVEVPTRFLGGPIWPALQVPVAAVGDPSALPAGMPSRPAAGRPLLVGPPALVEGPPASFPSGDPAAGDPDAGDDDGGIPGIDEPGDGDGPDDGVPLDRKLVVPTGPEPDDGDDAPDPDAGGSAPAAPVPPDAAALGPAHARLVSPAAGGWLMWQTPTLRWRATPGARYYNVQIFRGTRRVLNAWPGANRLVVPSGVLRQGRTYVWVVWPGAGPRAAGTYSPAVGRSTFAVTLRPRIVFRARGAAGVVGEVRPHIPLGKLRLERPRAVAGRVPAQVTLTRRGRFLLPIRPAQAERIGATLRDRGPIPPIGLRG